MCPVCIASSAVMFAGAGTAGAILIACIAKFRSCFGTAQAAPLQKT
jgi:hypothetical protein